MNSARTRPCKTQPHALTRSRRLEELSELFNEGTEQGASEGQEVKTPVRAPFIV